MTWKAHLGDELTVSCYNIKIKTIRQSILSDEVSAILFSIQTLQILKYGNSVGLILLPTEV